MAAALGETWRAFLGAARFLTRVPLPAPASAAGLGRSALFYPLIGLLLGALGAAVWLFAAPLPPLAAAALLLLLWTWASGALHLDGLADCADAWVGGLGSRERTLEILKDPCTGAVGVTVLVLILLAKFAALASLSRGLPAAGILLVAPALARAQLLALALTTAAARPDGMGAALAAALPRAAAWSVLALCWVAAGVLLAAAAGAAAALACATAALTVLLLWRRSLQQRLDGFTGDTAGALVELTETALLLAGALLLAAPPG